MRWIPLIGRTGSVILMTGLALALVSLIPPAAFFSFVRGGGILPEKYEVLRWYVLTPQVELRVSTKSNGSVYICLLGVSQLEFDLWARAQVKESPGWSPEVLLAMRDLAILEKFLQERPNVVLWKSPLGEELSYEFSPASILNVTVVIANPSPSVVEVIARIEGVVRLAQERVIAAAQWLILTGLISAAGAALIKRLRKTAKSSSPAASPRLIR